MPGGNPGTVGQVLVSQGPGMAPQWQNLSSAGDNWGSQVAVTAAPIIGDGTTSNPITLQTGNAAGDVLIFNGANWTIRQAPWDSVCNTAATNRIQKWVGNALCNSQIYDDGTNVGIGTTTPSQKLDVAGNIQFSGALMPGGNAGAPGQVLVSQGAGTAPTWTTLSNGGGGAFSCSDCPTMWSGVSSNTMTWGACARYCSNLTASGYTDWRMPTLFEAIELMRKNHPGTNTYYIWTATPVGHEGTYTSMAGYGYYVIRLSDGDWYPNSAYNNTQYRCRCVR